MQAYATPGRPPLNERLDLLHRAGSVPIDSTTFASDRSPVIADQVLCRLADLIVDRLIARTGADAGEQASEWLDAREAAAYLGVHRDTVRKLAAQRAIPVHQDGPGCKLYFRRDELDEWRRSGRPTRSGARLRAVA